MEAIVECDGIKEDDDDNDKSIHCEKQRKRITLTGRIKSYQGPIQVTMSLVESENRTRADAVIYKQTATSSQRTKNE
ncbi:unnamed protein product [Toxocara canis]|uniref:Ovule protein n=1 Tax=Toxocara canis TaxID=6265 RepID=A0A183UMS2_TOXCA|nr:unnamed protein product [Toxocara canis]